MARSRRTPAMLVCRCSSELSGHRPQGNLKSHSLRAKPRACPERSRMGICSSADLSWECFSTGREESCGSHTTEAKMHTALAAVTRELLLFRHDKHHPANFYTANLYNDNYGF